MKTIFITLLVVLGLTLSVKSQNATIDRTLGYDLTLLSFVGTTADTIGKLDSTFTYTVRKQSDTRVYPIVYVNLDKLNSTTKVVNTFLQYKTFANESYTNLDTITWTGTSDTSFTFNYGTAKAGEYYRIYVKANDDAIKVKVKYLDFIFKK